MRSSHYCIWGLCDSEHYCCGDNVCCKETNLNAVLIKAIILGTIAVMSLCCAYVCFNSRRIYGVFLKRYFKIDYKVMTTPQETKQGFVTTQESKENYVVQM